MAAPTLTYQGELNGENGAHYCQLSHELCALSFSQLVFCCVEETHDDVAVVDGVFTVVLGNQTDLDSAAQGEQPLPGRNRG